MHAWGGASSSKIVAGYTKREKKRALWLLDFLKARGLKQNTRGSPQAFVYLRASTASMCFAFITASHPNKNLNVSVLGIPVKNLTSDSLVICANLNEG